MNQSIGKGKPPVFYVVTRNGRRAWPRDYWTLDEAQAHAQSLANSLRALNDPGYKGVIIMETSDPESIN